MSDTTEAIVHTLDEPDLPSLTVERLITQRELLHRVPVDRSTIYRRIRLGTFPPPVESGGRLLWRSTDLREWMRDPSRWKETHPRRSFERSERHRRARAARQVTKTEVQA